MYCEDYPCCGHTPQDPCERQWYDEPDAFDTRKHPHALCNHEEGECQVDEEPEDEPYEQQYWLEDMPDNEIAWHGSAEPL